jgi:hypothetical protein
MSDWQPIETAPRDGTRVLIYPHYRVSHWVEEGEAFGCGPGFHGSFDVDEEKYWILSGVTHWLSLPSPPSHT